MKKYFHSIQQLFYMFTYLHTAFVSSIDLMHNSFVVSLSKKNFKSCQLLDDGFSFTINICSEIKFLFSECISLMSSLEILFKFAYRNVKVDVLIFMKNSSNKMN